MGKKEETKQIEAAPENNPVTALTTTETGGAVNTIMDVMFADAGVGTEYSASDLATPYFAILQAGSPQVLEENPKYIAGARPGMIINTVSGEIYDVRLLQNRAEPPVTIPVVFGNKSTKMVVEWKPERGGFVAHHVPGTPGSFGREVVNEEGKKKTVNGAGNELVETDYHYPVVCSKAFDEEVSWAIIAMSSTQLRNSRHLNSFIDDLKLTHTNGKKFKPPIYGLVFKLSTGIEKQKVGDKTWWGWVITYVGSVPDVFGAKQNFVFDAAKKYHADLASGVAKASAPSQESDAPSEIPF